MSGDNFSHRHGYRAADAEITIREDAPKALRGAILMIATSLEMSPGEIRRVVCETLRVTPDPRNWSEYPNIFYEASDLFYNAPWFRVYDIAESLYEYLSRDYSGRHTRFMNSLNNLFCENGVGWQMQDGQIVFRGAETFTETTRKAKEQLQKSGLPAATKELHEAFQDISRRPNADITGAITHAMAALECTARDVTGDSNRTLAQLLPKLALPAPLDAAVDKLWGYASDKARHVREGAAPGFREAELIVSVAGALCTFLSKPVD